MPALKNSHLAAGLLALCLLGAGPAFADPLVDVARHRPCNLFDLDEPVQFEATFQGLPPGEGKAVVVLTTFYNETTTVTQPLQVKDAQPVRMPLALGKLPPGYYKMKITAEVAGADGKPVIARSQPGSFGVVRFVQRTAAEAREQGMRFGLKIFQIGDPGVWWRRPLVWNLAEVVDACARTGLQWTRHQFNQEPNPAQPGLIGTNELITEHPMNVVLKVEGFPENCFDTGRYGPLEEWKAKHKGRSWTRSTVPAKEPYQAWLKAEVAKIPPGQNIFEIGNEVWNYLPAGEFAEWCRLAVVAIKEARPEAQIGADPGNGDEYTRSFLAAGGMDGMAIWFCHPYSFTPLPEHRVRAYLRNMRDILKGRTGRDFDLYVTEYGWSVAPQSTHAGVVSEVVQAQRTTRESLMLYAEDARALIPHWMGDREQDPKEREHWFGFFQLDQQPRPVFVAHAACARMIDGGKFVGDLPLGEGVGAMLFERGGTYTLAMWTAEGAKNVTVEVGTSAVTFVNMMGKEKPGATKDGKLELRLDANVTYLVGVSPALAERVIPPDKDLDPDVWSKRPETFQAGKMAAPPVIDGSLDDWKGRGATAIPPASTAASGGQAELRLGWDEQFVYAAVHVSGAAPGSHDLVDLGLGVRPARQPDMVSTLPYDYHFVLGSGDGQKPATLEVTNTNFDQPVACLGENDPSGIRWAVKPTEGGWTGEMAIPVAFLKGLAAPVAGGKISFCLVLQRYAAGSDKPVVQILGHEKSRLWSYLILQE